MTGPGAIVLSDRPSTLVVFVGTVEVLVSFLETDCVSWETYFLCAVNLKR